MRHFGLPPPRPDPEPFSIGFHNWLLPVALIINALTVMLVVLVTFFLVQ